MGENKSNDARSATILDSTAVALWHYQAEPGCITWCNPAALELWGLMQLDDVQTLDCQNLQQAMRDSPATGSLQLQFERAGRSILCRAQHTGNGLWLMEQLTQNTDTTQHTRALVAIYNPDGQVMRRSKNSLRLSQDAEQQFHQHFVDPADAERLWQQVQTQGTYSDAVMVHTRMGPRWHQIQLRQLDSDRGSIELTEQDLCPQVADYDPIDSILREQQVIQAHAGVGIALIRERRIIRCNHHFANIFGYRLDELIGRLGDEVYENADIFAAVGNEAYPVLLRGENFSKQLKMRRKDGELIWCKINGKIITPGQPERGFIWITQNIDDEVRSAQALQQLSHEQQLILEHATIGIGFLKNRIITRCNHKFAQIFGYRPEDLIGCSTIKLHRNGLDYSRIGREGYKQLKRGKVFEAEEILRHRDGSELWTELRAKAIDPSDLSTGTIWIAMNITRRKKAEIALNEARQTLELRVKERTRELSDAMQDLHQEIADRRVAEERIRHLAHHDPLTGLPNRSMLEERMQATLASAQRSDDMTAVLFIDLDRFKTINDSLGHQEGDQLLKHAASRFKQCIRSTDIVARLGGDEFVIILTHLNTLQDIEQVVEKIRDKFRQEMRLGLQELIVTLSIGVAVYPQDGTEPRTLLKNADAAMYHAKEKGRNRYQFFDPQMNTSLSERITLERALHQAIREQQFELYYQPQVNLNSGKIVGVEALIRWQHPDKGMISPMDFIPLAEETGQIIEMGDWVMLEACQTARRWQQQGLPPVTMSVNLSALQIHSDDFLHKVRQVLRESRLPARQLELEITESSIMRNVDETVDKLVELHELGVQLSIDDFGTGYSSLSYLKRFPLDKLKIDRSFVSEIDVDMDDAMICHTIISMAKSLSLKVVAEGAETEAHLRCLRAYGCDIYQGYYFSRPLPAREIEAMLAQQQQEASPLEPA